MNVVSNTTPLNYLLLIGRVEVLSTLYGRVVIPQAVFRELTSDSAPAIVRAWLDNGPPWLTVADAADIMARELDQIQIGERETILLAENIGSDFVLLDDRRARRIAQDRGLNVIGTLGILTSAGKQGLINLHDALDDLKQTSFRASSQLFELLVRPDSE